MCRFQTCKIPVTSRNILRNAEKFWHPYTGVDRGGARGPWPPPIEIWEGPKYHMAPPNSKENFDTFIKKLLILISFDEHILKIFAPSAQ